MTKVITFEHRGVRAAIPAEQALDIVHSSAPPERVEELWSGPDDGGDRWLRVRAAQGECWLSCHAIQLREVSGAALTPVSPLLSGVLKLPYVVGLASIEDQPTWLVDMTRFGLRLSLE